MKSKSLLQPLRCFAVLGCASALAAGVLLTPARSAQDAARPARPEETIVLEVPAGRDVRVVAQTIEQDPATGESRLTGAVTLTWPNGMRLSARDAKVSLVPLGKNGPYRVLIQPAPR